MVNLYDMEKKYDYVIVGAGIYGATMAYLIRNTYPSKEVLIIDKNDYVGGMCYDEWQDGILVQKHGAHIFHTSNQEVWDFVNKFGKWDQFCNCVKAKASDGKLYSLPFNMNTFYEIFKTETPEEAQKIIEKEIKKYGVKEPKNLEEQAISMVGKTIYEKLIKGYTEKQWKCKATELDPSIIKRLPLRYFYDNDYYNCLYEALPEEVLL